MKIPIMSIQALLQADPQSATDLMAIERKIAKKFQGSMAKKSDLLTELAKIDDPKVAKIRKLLKMSVDDLELSVRSHNCLKAADIQSIGDLVRRDESEMLKFRNFGRKSLQELSKILEEKGLHFGMDVDKYLKGESS